MVQSKMPKVVDLDDEAYQQMEVHPERFDREIRVEMVDPLEITLEVGEEELEIVVLLEEEPDEREEPECLYPLLERQNIMLEVEEVEDIVIIQRPVLVGLVEEEPVAMETMHIKQRPERQIREEVGEEAENNVVPLVD